MGRRTVDLDKQTDRQMGGHQHLGHGQTEAAEISQELSIGWSLDTHRVDKSIVLGTLLLWGSDKGLHSFLKRTGVSKKLLSLIFLI